MSDNDNLAKRVAVIERELAQLKQSVEGMEPKQNWIDKLTGSFKDDPEFDEIVKLGREYRESQRPESHG